MTSTRNVRVLDSLIRAFRQVPKEVSRLTYMKIAAGDYTDFPNNLDMKFVDDGCLVMEGLGDPVVIAAGPYTAGTVAGVGDDKGIVTVTPSGGGLTANAFSGYFLHLLTGDNAGKMFSILRNSTTVIYLANTAGASALIANSDTFDIVRMPVRITIDHPITWTIEDGGLPDGVTALANRSRLVMNGIEIKTTWNPQASAYLPAFRFIGRGTPAQIYMHNCKLQGYGVNHFVELDNAYINKCAPVFPTTAALFEERVYSAYPSNHIVMNNGTLPTATDPVWVIATGNSGLCGFTMRGAINCLGNGATNLGGTNFEAYRCLVNSYAFSDCRWALIASAADSLVSAGYCASSLRCNGYINGYYALTGQDALYQEGGQVTGDSFECSVSGVTAYGLRIGHCGTFINLSGCDAIGATDDIFLVDKATGGAVDWPAAGAAVADSLGTTVMTIK
jgi:hypothetical protein